MCSFPASRCRTPTTCRRDGPLPAPSVHVEHEEEEKCDGKVMNEEKHEEEDKLEEKAMNEEK